ncbi:YegS/Rv2252/BmrU family lipid kinase [Bacillus oleivorans]|uniref:YegS/Rv2252/BmrU family lipid kinase n=1 Tax=Bacillus oleivorans TaxID=1448271 RepID=A0A285CUK6_9BACI|nr:diacylglycerol kinase family protein [Bacillus oleivorans]SNX70726.1 YegS/Rv2252/BmrU family lipid kinase [Bacillus oleivorans]
MYYFIVNKVSGNGRALKVWSQIEKILQNEEISYSVFFTERPKHATLLVQEMIHKENVTAIVAVGGDGTVQEVINGLVGTNIPLGIIPAGSGNDFSRGLFVPLNHDKALQRILTGTPKIIDIGLVNSTYFCTVTGIGFDGEVAQKTNASQYKKLLNYVRLGQISYIFSALNVLIKYKPADISLIVDNKLYKIPKVWLIAVANFPFYGGGIAICPEAKNNDGVFDICIVQGMSRLEFLRVFPLAFKGKHTNSPYIKIIRGKEIIIDSQSPLVIHGDGEMIGQTPAQIKIEPNALYVM